jgi:hypothetical protein
MGKYHCTIDLLFDWFGMGCMTTDNFCFYSQNRLIPTSQTGGQLYSNTSPFSIPWSMTRRLPDSGMLSVVLLLVILLNVVALFPTFWVYPF